ncbi:NADH dehydrogenase [ubiquinone] 1 beta subcomplex subunit 7-like [Amyelois transitella]|uniref:NADH dehydrogenase [ubiquinone] 1 beta subcomplex subunit 7-like n=1 Tax=Amyelois transitella TaxID=680683 RepID=UPI00298FEEDD|nr:NADH dehydrogenase [ubiquinone] 1 beta subcomplex subunit 7-like [Amyelois transitella]
MGTILGSFLTKEIGLDMNDKPSFPPAKGFNIKRGQRVMLACEDDLKSARIPLKHRDYCAHLLIKYHMCRYKNMPFLLKCAHEKHAYLNCEKDDYVLRLKEFEREKRLREREIRIKKAKG